MIQAFLRRYARAQAEAATPFVVGQTLLDLGAGEGYVAPALRARRGVWICSADVGPFRRAAGPYVTYDGRRLPFRDAAFDTTLLFLVLHHAAEPEAVLDEAVRVTRHRLIVMESVYRNRRERLWLDLLDGRLNRYRHDGKMNVPFAFRRPEEWRQLFASRGLRTVETRWLGSWWERLVHHPLLFVLDRVNPASMSLDSAARGTVDSAHDGNPGRLIGDHGHGSGPGAGGAIEAGRRGRPRGAHGALCLPGLPPGAGDHP